MAVNGQVFTSLTHSSELQIMPGVRKCLPTAMSSVMDVTEKSTEGKSTTALWSI